MATRKLEIKIVGDDRDIQRTFGRTGKAADGWGRKLIGAGKLAAAGLAAGGAAAAATGWKLTNLAGDAAEVESKFQVTFGREMPKMVRDLDKFSEATGASRFELRQQAADLGALLVPMIGSQKEASGLSMQMVKLATDLSSFNNIPVAEALEKIRAGLVGEAEPLRSVGVLLSEAAVKQEAYRAGIAKTGAELTEQQKVQARANLILDQTKLAHGDATRTADSFTNQLRRLRNSISDNATELGTKLLPHVTGFLQKVNEDVVPAVEDWAGALRDELKPRLDAVADWASDHKDDFTNLFDEATESAGELATALGQVAKGVDKGATSIGGWDDAFSLVLSGALASGFLKVLRRLQGPSGKGGIVGALTRIKAFGPVLALTIGIDVLLNGKDSETRRFLDWLNQSGPGLGKHLPEWMQALIPAAGNAPLPGPSGGPTTVTPQGTIADPRGGGFTTPTGNVTFSGGVTKPKPHVLAFVRRVAGIHGSALNVMSGVRTGSVVVDSGNPSQHGTGDAADIGPYTGETLTRIGQAALIAAGMPPALAYKQATYVGTVNGVNILFNTWVGGNHWDHVHVGLRSLPAEAKETPTTVTPDATSSGGSGSGAGAGGGGTAKSPPLIPNNLQLALARAEGTKGMKDDLSALTAIESYLAKRLTKTKDVEKKIALQEALNRVRSQVEDMNAELAEKEKERVSKLNDALDRWRENAADKFAQTVALLKERIADRREGFGAAFGTVADQLARAFDAKTEQLLANVRAKVAAFGFEIGVGEETPAERALREFREQRDAEERARRRAAATTPEEIAALDLEDKERALAAAAAAERQAADEALAAERKRIEEERSTKRSGFLGALTDLEEHWSLTNASSEQRMEELKALLKEYDLPFSEVGTLVGDAFATAFLDSLKVVFDKLAELRSVSNEFDRLPGHAAEVPTANRFRFGRVPAFAGGVRNFPGGFALVGERGPELVRLPGGADVIPNHRLGGVTVHVTMPGAVILGRSPEAVRELVRSLEPELARVIKQATG